MGTFTKPASEFLSIPMVKEHIAAAANCLWEVVEFARAAHCKAHTLGADLVRAERERAGQP